jgi:hypothetical protein
VPKPPFKSLFCNFVEATRATTLNKPKVPEIPTVTIASYILQYEVFVDGKITESWAGKVDFCKMPGENAVARVIFPLTEECTRLVNANEYEEWTDTWTATEVRVIVMEAATIRTPIILPKNEHIGYVEYGIAEFNWYTIAQRLPEGDNLRGLLVCPRIEFSTPSMLADPTNNARSSL